MDKVKGAKVQRDSFNIEDAFKFVFFLLVAISVATVIYTIVLMVIAESMGMDFTEFYITPGVQIVTIAFSPIFFLLFFYLYCAKAKINLKLALADSIKKSLLPVSVAIVLSIICIFLITPFVSMVEHLFTLLGFHFDDTIPYLMYMQTNPLHLLIGILILGVLTAVAEEYVFRGLVLRGLYSKFDAVSSILVSSVIFTLAHGSASQTVYQMLMGIILGYLALVGGSILYSIVLHCLNNVLVILLNVYNGIDYLNSSTQMYNNVWQFVFPILLFLLAVSLVAILFWVLKYLRNKHYFVKPTKAELDKESTPDEKITIIDFWRYSIANEKVYMIACFAFGFIMWLINTFNGYTG